MRLGVAWAWLTVLLCILPKCHIVKVDFGYGHRVISRLAAWSRSYRQFFTPINTVLAADQGL